MNIREYISSGILEAYALGELSEKERSEVENNLARYPELREELALIEEAQEKLLMQAAIKPRDLVREKIFAAVDQQKPEAKVIALSPPNNTISLWKFTAAASITIALITSYLAYTYHDKWKATQSDLTNLIAQSQRVAQEYNQVNQRLNKIEEDLRVIDNPAFTRIIMNGTPNAPGATAYVYWNENTREVYLSVQNMKTLAQENQYQLWAIVDGKPVDAGVFDGGIAGGLLKMKDIGTGAATFAVTIEPRGGKPSPTLETMQVAGNVVKG
ncbi:MAG TPA: anti-sigma factor [Ohtaekwangia sp.]|uniref:anti-sigma factor n=1 Tax=Ohtaekwangia sp. TaxID=2066019 RepID=UPI002F936181